MTGCFSENRQWLLSGLEPMTSCLLGKRFNPLYIDDGCSLILLMICLYFI